MIPIQSVSALEDLKKFSLIPESLALLQLRNSFNDTFGSQSTNQEPTSSTDTFDLTACIKNLVAGGMDGVTKILHDIIHPIDALYPLLQTVYDIMIVYAHDYVHESPTGDRDVLYFRSLSKEKSSYDRSKRRLENLKEQLALLPSTVANLNCEEQSRFAGELLTTLLVPGRLIRGMKALMPIRFTSQPLYPLMPERKIFVSNFAEDISEPVKFLTYQEIKNRKNAKFIYVINQDKQVRLASASKKLDYNHWMLADEPVYSAGELSISKGKISVNNDSGSYRIPYSKELAQATEHALTQYGFPIAKVKDSFQPSRMTRDLVNTNPISSGTSWLNYFAGIPVAVLHFEQKQICDPVAAVDSGTEIGSGCYGTVYRPDLKDACHKLCSNEKCVIKVTTLNDTRNNSSNPRMIRKLQELADAKIIPRSHLQSNWKEKEYNVMDEVLASQTLDKWLAEHLHEKKAKVHVTNRLLEKLKKMHEMGVTHGDLHGRNIPVDSNNEPWIIDLDHAQTNNPSLSEKISDIREVRKFINPPVKILSKTKSHPRTKVWIPAKKWNRNSYAHAHAQAQIWIHAKKKQAVKKGFNPRIQSYPDYSIYRRKAEEIHKPQSRTYCTTFQDVKDIRLRNRLQHAEALRKWTKLDWEKYCMMESVKKNKPCKLPRNRHTQFIRPRFHHPPPYRPTFRHTRFIRPRFHHPPPYRRTFHHPRPYHYARFHHPTLYHPRSFHPPTFHPPRYHYPTFHHHPRFSHTTNDHQLDSRKTKSQKSSKSEGGGGSSTAVENIIQAKSKREARENSKRHFVHVYDRTHRAWFVHNLPENNSEKQS